MKRLHSDFIVTTFWLTDWLTNPPTDCLTIWPSDYLTLWLNRPHIDPSEPLMKYEELGGGWWSSWTFDLLFSMMYMFLEHSKSRQKHVILPTEQQLYCMVCQDTDFKICLCSNSTNSTLFIVHLLGTNKTGELVNVTPGDLGLRQISTFSGFPNGNLPGLLFLWEVWATFLLSWNDVSTDELIGELLTLHMALSSSRWLISSDLHCWLYFLFLYRTLYQTDLNEQSEHQEGTGRGQKCRVHNKKVEWGRGGVWKKPRPPNSLPPLVIWPTCSPD